MSARVRSSIESRASASRRILRHSTIPVIWRFANLERTVTQESLAIGFSPAGTACLSMIEMLIAASPLVGLTRAAWAVRHQMGYGRFNERFSERGFRRH